MNKQDINTNCNMCAHPRQRSYAIYCLVLYVTGLAFVGQVKADTIAKITQKPGFIPFDKVLELKNSRVYECWDFDASTNTCTRVASTSEAAGAPEVTVRMIASPALIAVMSSSVFLKDGLSCVDLKATSIRIEGDAGDELKNSIADLYRSLTIELGEVCTAYFQTDKGVQAVTYRLSGDELIDGVEQKVNFFKETRSLRVENK